MSLTKHPQFTWDSRLGKGLLQQPLSVVKMIAKSSFTSYCGNLCSVGFVKMFMPNIWHTIEELLTVDMGKSP